MKRIASLVVLVFFTANCFAQLPVNTTAQKKKIAFQNTRTSLREIESQTVFGEKLM